MAVVGAAQVVVLGLGGMDYSKFRLGLDRAIDGGGSHPVILDSWHRRDLLSCVAFVG